MALPLSDSFTYANGNLAGNGTWSVPAGTINVASNQAKLGVNTFSLALSSETATTYAMDVSIDYVAFTDAFSSPHVAASLYFNSSTDFGYVLGGYSRNGSGGGNWNIASHFNVLTGGYTTIASVTEAPPTLPVTLRLVNCCGQLKFYVNGTLKLSGFDAIGAKGLHAGFASGNLNDTLDNFVFANTPCDCGGWHVGAAKSGAGWA